MLLHLKGLTELGQPAILPLIVWGVKHFVQIASVLGAYWLCPLCGKSVMADMKTMADLLLPPLAKSSLPKKTAMQVW